MEQFAVKIEGVNHIEKVKEKLGIKTNFTTIRNEMHHSPCLYSDGGWDFERDVECEMIPSSFFLFNIPEIKPGYWVTLRSKNTGVVCECFIHPPIDGVLDNEWYGITGKDSYICKKDFNTYWEILKIEKPITCYLGKEKPECKVIWEKQKEDKVELTLTVNGKKVPLDTISEETLISIRNQK